MATDQALQIVMIAAEAAPYAKVGGLGDVLGALPRALEKLGAGLTVIIPAYGEVTIGPFSAEPCRELPGFDVTMGNLTEYAYVFRATMPQSDITVYRIGSQRYFDRPGIYDDPYTHEGYSDNMERYIFFMRAALELLARRGRHLDIIHCHDSQTGLIPGLLRESYGGVPVLGAARTVFTIHNLAYQGDYGQDALFWAGIPQRRFYPASPFEFWGRVNFMKAGIALADEVTTVSPTYAREIQEPELGMGLDGVLREKQTHLRGIINGIDYDEWDPAADPLLPARFSASRLAGKAVCKLEVLRFFGLDTANTDRPLLGMVSRLADQKGFDLLAAVIDRLMEMDLRMVVLGTGQQHYHDLLNDMATRHPGRFAVRLAFDNTLAHLIEAGCDMFLMPSRFEPCGLNQLYSLRYGTIPIVHSTGGLADTVTPYDGNRGTGFRFDEYSAEALVRSAREALLVYSDQTAWKKLMLRAMLPDWSWRNSARRYLELYLTMCRPDPEHGAIGGLL